MSDQAKTDYAICEPTQGRNGRVIFRARMVIIKVPASVTPGDVMNWLDDYEAWDCAVPKNEWSANVQLTAKTADVIRWTGSDHARSSDPLSAMSADELLDLRAALTTAIDHYGKNLLRLRDLSYVERWRALAERIDDVTGRLSTVGAR